MREVEQNPVLNCEVIVITLNLGNGRDRQSGVG